VTEVKLNGNDQFGTEDCSVLNREVSSWQRCPQKEVALYFSFHQSQKYYLTCAWFSQSAGTDPEGEGAP
jgi:hypothetical protein